MSFFVPLMKTVSAFIEQAKLKLKFLYDASELQQIIFLLLEEELGYSRDDLRSGKEHDLDHISSENLNRFLSKLIAGEPLQYVLGYAWFYGMRFKVDKSVLIPRPETEELIAWLLSHNSGCQTPYFVLDIGTGSGCIAVSLKKALPAADIVAIDVSGEALLLAKQNAEMNSAKVNFLRGDILSQEVQNSLTDKFDIIISNPPYVRKSEMNSMAAHVRDHEPHTALFVQDDDPLIFYRRIADLAKANLKEGGQLFFEVNAALGTDVMGLLLAKGFQNVELKKDISGNDRMIRATLNSNKDFL